MALRYYRVFLVVISGLQLTEAALLIILGGGLMIATSPLSPYVSQVPYFLTFAYAIFGCCVALGGAIVGSVIVRVSSWRNPLKPSEELEKLRAGKEV